MRLFVLALSAMLSPMLLAQTRVPEAEPNNTAGTAQPILIGDQIEASLPAAGDQDWFSFTVPVAGRIRIHTTNAGTLAAPLVFADTRIALLDGTGTTYLAIDDDARGAAYGWCSELQLNVAAGTYMCQVTQFSATDLGPYTLEISSITPVVYDGFEAEPNDTAATATPTGVLGVGGKRFHGALGANTVVFSGTCDAPVVPPVVYSGACVPFSLLFSGVVNAAPASTTTTTQSATPLLQPLANPLLVSYVPGMNISMTSGPNIGLGRLISSNTASSVASAAFPAANVGGNTYDIVTVNTTTVTWVGSLPVQSMFTANLGYSMVMTSGVNIGLIRTISAGTGPAAFGSALTTAAFPFANAPGDTFDVICTGSTQAIRVLGALVPNAWNPTTGGSTLGHFHIRFTSGVNAGLYRQIRSNTGASIATETVLTAAAAAGDTFDVEMVDTDYYQVVLTAPRTGLWFQINEGDNGMVYGHRYELYDAAGNALLPASSLQLPAFGTQNATPGNTQPHTSSARIWPAGTYYIAIRNPQVPYPAAPTMPGGVVPSGPYVLEVFTMPMNVGATVAEAEAPGTQSNNTTATAQPLVPGDVGQGNLTISTGTDPSDWFGPIVISVPSTLSFQTRRRAGSLTPLLDTTVNLRDSTGAIALTATTGNILDVPSTSTTGLHGRVVVTFYLAPDTYYIDVSSPLTTTFGDYELETSVLMPAPYVLASYVTIASNAGCGTAPQPVLTTFVAPGVPAVSEVPATGSLMCRQITNLNGSPFLGGFLGLHVMGLANLLPPLDLAIPFGGTLGACFLNVSPDVINAVVSDGAGVVQLQIVIPGTIALRGFVLWEQAIDFDLSAPNGFSLQPGNYARFLIGERTY